MQAVTNINTNETQQECEERVNLLKQKFAEQYQNHTELIMQI